MNTYYRDIALIVDKKRRLLTARRPKSEDHPKDWELPQITTDEKEDTNRLKDYLKKTFRVRTIVRDSIKQESYIVKRYNQEYKLRIRIYLVELKDAVVKSDDHVKLDWVRVHNYEDINWTPETSIYIDDVQSYVIGY